MKLICLIQEMTPNARCSENQNDSTHDKNDHGNYNQEPHQENNDQNVNY